MRASIPTACIAIVALMPWVGVAAAMDAQPARLGNTEAGLPFIHNFEPAEYDGSSQNWPVAQGHDGVIHVGNVEDGVLMSDGARRQLPEGEIIDALRTSLAQLPGTGPLPSGHRGCRRREAPARNGQYAVIE
ncbi:MAG: hypothetical protein ACTHJP_07890 [Rhodanobacteraceae bacterium]